MSSTILCSEDTLTQQHSLRSWLQLCGCKERRCNPLHYFGQDCHLFEISIVEENIQGALLPIRVLKGTRGEWCQVGTVERPPGRQRFALSYFEPCVPYLPFFHSLGKSPFHIYELVGDCSAVTDPASGWSSYVQVYSGVRLEMRRSATRTSRVSQAPIDTQLLGTVDTVFRYAPVRLRLGSDLANPTSKIVDMEYDCRTQCGSCGSSCSGCGSCGNLPACPYDRLYVLTQNNTTGLIRVDSHLIDTDQLTSTTVTSTTGALGCAVTATSLTICGGNVVVSTKSTGTGTCPGVYYAPILPDGTLGEFRESLNTSIQTLKCCGDWLVMGGASFGTSEGRILLSKTALCDEVHEPFTIAAGVGFNSIDCCGKKFVAGGDQGTLVVSNNGGYSWTILSSPTSDDITAVAVSGSDIWVGTDIGDLYMSCNAGYSWSLVASVAKAAEINLLGATDGGAIRNIQFANGHVGYFTSGNEIFSTYSGGAYWSKGCPRFEMGPDVQGAWENDFSYKALAIPTCMDYQEGSNRLALGVGGAAANFTMTGSPIIEGFLAP